MSALVVSKSSCLTVMVAVRFTHTTAKIRQEDYHTGPSSRGERIR